MTLDGQIIVKLFSNPVFTDSRKYLARGWSSTIIIAVRYYLGSLFRAGRLRGGMSLIRHHQDTH